MPSPRVIAIEWGVVPRPPVFISIMAMHTPVEATEVVRDYTALGALMLHRNRDAEAEPLFRQALTIDKEDAVALRDAVSTDLADAVRHQPRGFDRVADDDLVAFSRAVAKRHHASARVQRAIC